MIDFGNDTDHVFSEDQLPDIGLYVLAFFRDRRLGGDYATVACRTSEYMWKEQGSERRISFDPLCWSLITKPDGIPHCEDSPYYPQKNHLRLRNQVRTAN